VYPGEQLNLHIFEPRYKQLIKECVDSKKAFGIPSVIDDKLNDTGTLVAVTEVIKIYKDGKMDIKTEGLEVFKILEVIKELPEKLYSGAIVNYPENNNTGNRTLMQTIIAAIRELHKLLKITKEFKKADNELWSYDVAHHAGLSLTQEYELLQLFQELQRQEYLKRHLKKAIPLIAEMETLKKRVKLNGHFKDLKGFDV
jgi:Lon protease-like protein